MSGFILKMVCGDDVRRARLPTFSVEVLRNLTRESFGREWPACVELKYRDDEGDLCTLVPETLADLKELIGESRTIRLEVFLRESSLASRPASAVCPVPAGGVQPTPPHVAPEMQQERAHNDAETSEQGLQQQKQPQLQPEPQLEEAQRQVPQEVKSEEISGEEHPEHLCQESQQPQQPEQPQQPQQQPQQQQQAGPQQEEKVQGQGPPSQAEGRRPHENSGCASSHQFGFPLGIVQGLLSGSFSGDSLSVYVVRFAPLLLQHIMGREAEVDTALQGKMDAVLPIIATLRQALEPFPQFAEAQTSLEKICSERRLDGAGAALCCLLRAFCALPPEEQRDISALVIDGIGGELARLVPALMEGGCCFMEESAQAPSQKDESDFVSHWGITCDGCNATPIRGPRFKCAMCADFDLCDACFSRKDELHIPGHEFEQINSARTELPTCCAAAWSKGFAKGLSKGFCKGKGLGKGFGKGFGKGLGKGFGCGERSFGDGCGWGWWMLPSCEPLWMSDASWSKASGEEAKQWWQVSEDSGKQWSPAQKEEWKRSREQAKEAKQALKEEWQRCREQAKAAKQAEKEEWKRWYQQQKLARQEDCADRKHGC